jgi:HlyD family secretion protein
MNLLSGLPVKKLSLIAAGLAATVLAGFFLLGKNGNRQEYKTETITRGAIQATVIATGTVNPVTTVLVGTQVSGTIKSIFVDFNSPVKKGQLIAQIDPEIFEAQAAQAKANADKADAALRDAERTLQRMQALFARNLIARSEFDTAETNFEAARAQADLAAATLRSSETNLRYTKILSPVDGIVISRNVDVGQTVAASFQTPTLFTIAQDLSKMQIDTNVAEADIGLVRVGQDVEFTVDAYPEIMFTGRVWQIRRAPIIVQNVVTYDVVVQVHNRDLKLMPGMTANVSVVLATKQDVLRIPNAALRFRPSEQAPGKASAGAEKKGPGVWVLENGKPKRVGITLGISDGSYTEVVSGELKEGQHLIIEALKKSKSQAPAGPRMF